MRDLSDGGGRRASKALPGRLGTDSAVKIAADGAEMTTGSAENVPDPPGGPDGVCLHALRDPGSRSKKPGIRATEGWPTASYTEEVLVWPPKRATIMQRRPTAIVGRHQMGNPD